MVEEVLHDRRRAFGYRWAVILDDAEQRGHGVEEVVRGLALEQLYDRAPDAPGG